MSGTEDFARSAVERLSEDEVLRGDLSDAGFGPLLDWATAAAMAYGAKATDQASMDAYTDRLRGVVMAAVDVAAKGKLENPAELLDFDPANPVAATAALKALKLGEDADENAGLLAGVLQSALQNPPSAGNSAPSKEPAPDKPTSSATKTDETRPNQAETHRNTPPPNPNKSGRVSAFFKKLTLNRRKS